MAAANSARNRKSASLKVVPANTDQGVPDPATIANALSTQAYDLSKLFRAIARVNASEMPCEDGKDEEDWDITILTEIGKRLSEKLADTLNSFSVGLSGDAVCMAEAVKSAEVPHG
jgi:hypothetical protein